jgi:hypothetical protein
MATPEWKKWTIADAGTVKDIADTAKELAEQIKTTSTLASTAMGIVKIIAELQSANIFLKALEAVADELIKSIQDMKDAGYYYLYVDPYSSVKNVEPKTKKSYGFEQLRDDSGRPLYWNTNAPDPEATTTYSVPPPMQHVFEPKLAMPRKLVAGGWSPYTNSTVDPFSLMSPFPKYSAKQVLETMAEAFSDEGDVPKYERIQLEGPPAVNPTKGDIVFNEQGDPVAGYDPTKFYGEQLYNMGSKNRSGSDHTNEDLKNGMWKSSRIKINTKIKSGKPNIQGNTEFGAGSSAIVMLIAAPSYDIFIESFNAFSKLFSDIPEFMEASLDKLMDTYKEFTDPPLQTINLTMCDSQYGLFAVGDVIRGVNYGGLGTISEILSTEATSIVSTALYTITDDIGITRRTLQERDGNSTGRYQDMVVTIKPIATKEANAVETFTPQDSVREQEIKGYWGVAPEKYPNYMTKGAATFQFKGVSATQFEETSPMSKRKGNSKRIYPKYGTVAMQKLTVPVESISPDFNTIASYQVIPMWNEFFEMLENFVVSVKGYVATSSAFIQDMIDTLNELIEFLEEMIETITKFLAFFEVDLSGAGIYALHIEDQQEGNAGLASGITSADGLPDNLGYAAGIVFVGVEVGGFNALDKFMAPILMA